MDKSWSLLEQSFKETDEKELIESCSSGNDSDYEIQKIKRPKLSDKVNKSFNVSSKEKKLTAQKYTTCDDNINELSSDDLFDDKDISPCSSPAKSQFGQSLCTIASQTAFALNSEPKMKKKKLVKNGLAMKCQALINQQKSSMFLLNFSSAEENKIELKVEKKIEEFGKTFILSNDDIVVLKPEQAKLYKINSNLNITSSTEFFSIKPKDSILNVYLNVNHICLKNNYMQEANND